MAVDDHVDHAVVVEIFAALEALGQLLTDGLLDDAWAGKADERARLGDGAPLAVRAVRRDRSGDRPRVVVDVAAPGNGPVALFAEGPTPDWALPVPEPVAGAPAGEQRFAFVLDGLPPGARADGALLRFTLAAPSGAIEVSTHLD